MSAGARTPTSAPSRPWRDRKWRARSRVFWLVAVVTMAAAACSAFGDEQRASVPASDASADSSSSAEDAGHDSPAPGCREPGPPVLDTTFGLQSLPVETAPRMALEPSGRIAFVGMRSGCTDATAALSIHVLLDDGGAFSLAPCFGEGEVPISFFATTNGYLLTSATAESRETLIRQLDANGNVLQLARVGPSSGDMYRPTFAVELSGRVIWGGYRTGTTLPTVGILGFVEGSSAKRTPELDSIPVTAAIEGQDLYVLFTPAALGAPKHVVLRKYSIAGNSLLEDVTYANNDRSRLEGVYASPTQMAGFGSMTVRDGVVTIAVPTGMSSKSSSSTATSGVASRRSSATRRCRTSPRRATASSPSVMAVRRACLESSPTESPRSSWLTAGLKSGASRAWRTGRCSSWSNAPRRDRRSCECTRDLLVTAFARPTFARRVRV